MKEEVHLFQGSLKYPEGSPRAPRAIILITNSIKKIVLNTKSEI